MGGRLGHFEQRKTSIISKARRSKAYCMGEENTGARDQVINDFICHVKGSGLYPITEKFNGASGEFALISQK